MTNQRALTGISSIDAEQTDIFNSLGVKNPAQTNATPICNGAFFISSHINQSLGP